MVQRRGKPRKREYVTTWGETVKGAYLGKDGRLRPTGKSTPAFGPASDEKLAVHRFKLWQKRTGIAPDDFDPYVANSALASLVLGERERIRTLILNDPKQAALDLNIPHLADYAPKPERPQFTLIELGADWEAKARNIATGKRVGAKNREISLKHWKGFADFVKVKHLREVTSDHINNYYHAMMAKLDNKTYAPDTIKGHFITVKKIIKHGLRFCSTETDKAECRRVLDLCLVFQAPSSPKNPCPLEVDHFQKLYHAANIRQKAILLLGVNAALHSGEVGKLLKTDIDIEKGTLSTRRSKTNNPRVAKLWGRTIDALRDYLKTNANRQHSPYLFVSQRGENMTDRSVQQFVFDLRKKLNLPEFVTFEGLRDSAYQYAYDVNPTGAKMLAGHNCGMEDHYVLRNADSKMIKECCEAIETHFFPQNKKKAGIN